MKLKILLAASTLLFAAGCGMMNRDTSYAERSETVTLTGTIEEVDLESRLFKVRDGRTAVVFRAGPQVQNLDQVMVGDQVTLDYYESVAVGMADPDDPGTAVGEVIGGVAAPGERPAAGVIGSVTGVVEFVSYDPDTQIATVKLQDGTLETARVQPEMQAFAAARVPGDRIVVVIDRAVAIAVTAAE
ncbi:hypothetical protein [Tropicimonas sediminicola]|uniref:DUF5666 domain-containing protein n=1 Tax=Tropicimonas sediminicola TaxID=1031541 RepID=A0A239C402_9RHOB|nr:hypothetical protein [Tropicimonas sediminicola]SNS14632.1 hypothetical protein SAMN05421757_10165 [Tropicimonas sediminicola]